MGGTTVGSVAGSELEEEQRLIRLEMFDRNTASRKRNILLRRSVPSLPWPHASLRLPSLEISNLIYESTKF